MIRKISIFRNGLEEPIIVYDNEHIKMIEYMKRLSKIMTDTEIEIVSFNNCSIIVRPSKIELIKVEELEDKETSNIKVEIKEDEIIVTDKED